jgi:hypothetical protein
MFKEISKKRILARFENIWFSALKERKVNSINIEMK